MRRKGKRGIRGASNIDQKIMQGYFGDTFVGFLSAEEVKALVGTLRITVEELVSQLLPRAVARSIVPVSGNRAGAICRGTSGNLYFGATLEVKGNTADYVVHAVKASIANAISKGEIGLKAITGTARICDPCRDFIRELHTVRELKIEWPNQPPISFGDMLTRDFEAADPTFQGRLMEPQSHRLCLENQIPDNLTQKALEAASSSYAPYSNDFSGVAVEVKTSQIYSGSYAENEAKNSILTPLQSAIVNMIMAGGSYADISRVVLVSVNEPSTDSIEPTKEMLESISNAPLTIEHASVSPG